jgi:hypothetical protein
VKIADLFLLKHMALDIDKKYLNISRRKSTAAPVPWWKGWEGTDWEGGRYFIIAGKPEMSKFCMRNEIIVLKNFK